MIGAVFAFFGTPLGKYVAGGLLIVLVIGGIYWAGHRSGREGALDDVNRQNEKAIENADKARDTVDGCYASGGVWNRSTGHCEGGVSGIQRQP